MPGIQYGPASGVFGYTVESGDTVYHASIEPAWVFPKGKRMTKDMRQYYRLVYNFNKVYPYALMAKDLSSQVDDYIAGNNMRRKQKDKYISQMEKELMRNLKTPIKKMSISQGKLLIRLIDREVGRSSYKLIKDYKSGFSAGFWQGVARLFGHNLKDRYDPKGRDKTTEYLVEKWQKGEFDEVYFSIFWEMPKRTEIPSVRIKFED